MFDKLAHIKSRQDFLHRQFDVRAKFEELEESCIPSYVHSNKLAGGIAWWRLFAAAELFKAHAPSGPVLDFGAGSGELANLLGNDATYEFIEEDETLARHISDINEGAVRIQLDALEPERYAAVFALDSLEHNENYPELLATIKRAIRPDGIFVLSGPTENWIYKLGRRIAGFEGHYHVTTIYDIERACAEIMTCTRTKVIPVPALAPLFRITLWKIP